MLFAQVYNEKGSFLGYLLTIQNGCPTVKAFHGMNLNQNKCLNSNTASNILNDTSNVSDSVFDIFQKRLEQSNRTFQY